MSLAVINTNGNGGIGIKESLERKELQSLLAHSLEGLSTIELRAITRTFMRVSGQGAKNYGNIMSLERLREKANPVEIAEEIADALFYVACMVELAMELNNR